MSDNNTNKWVVGLYYVQFTKNTKYHEGIQQSKYEYLKRGLFSSSLPPDKLQIITVTYNIYLDIIYKSNVFFY